MRYPTRASEPVHRRLRVPPSPLHEPSVQELHDESPWRWEAVRCVLDWGHQNGMVRPCSGPTSNRMLGRGAKDKEHAMSQKLESAIAVIGIDIGKNSFHVVGHDERGAIVLRQKWSRGQVEARFANMPTCLIGMEACVGAHHLSRKLQMLGHDARLMPAKYVRPYSKGQKNDFRDAEAIAEAVQRPTMKFVATKTADQLDLQGCTASAIVYWSRRSAGTISHTNRRGSLR